MMAQVVVGLTLGTLFLRAGISAKGVDQRQGFFGFLLALFIFTSTEALPVFLNERQIFIRETSRGAYRVSAYVLSQALVILPFLFVLAMIFSCVSYFMVGLAKDAGAFFSFVFILFLTLAVANAFVAFMASFVPDMTAGNALSSALFAYFFLFSGFFIPRYRHFYHELLDMVLVFAYTHRIANLTSTSRKCVSSHLAIHQIQSKLMQEPLYLRRNSSWKRRILF